MTNDTNDTNDRLQGYTVDQHGMISSLGKFEGEYMDAPYWWTQVLDGGAAESYTDTDGQSIGGLIIITDADRAIWPELRAEIYGVLVTEDDNGFVRVQHLPKAEYDTIVREQEQEQAEQADPNG